MSPTNLIDWPATPSPAGQRYLPIEEQLLGPALRELASRLPNAPSGVLAALEFAGPNGIADFVATVGFRRQLAARLETSVPPITRASEVAVLSVVPVNRTVGSQAIARRLGFTDRQVQDAGRSLERVGAIQRVGAGYRRHPGMEPVGRMYALEAKVRDWRRATSQALRYLTWADAAGVVLLHPPAQVEEARGRLRELGIGLAIGSKWLVRPRIHPNRTALRFLASEVFVASVWDSSDTARFVLPDALRSRIFFENF